ncbi:hypothetical protein BJ546DRAFT_1113332 [Cryomyces antarcticus]
MLSNNSDEPSTMLTRDISVSWYSKELENLSDPTRKLLQTYSGIAPDQVIPHIYKVPCIGQFRFLDLSIGSHPSCALVVQRLKDGQKLLDLGCCFGQDIRKLVSDGVPSENCYGADLRLDFIDTGYDLFRDKETLKSKFIAADIFDDNSELNQLDGQIDIVHAASFLHFFDWTDQMSAAKRIVKLLKLQTGSLTIGRQVGNVTAGEQPRRVENGSRMFRHNEESFRRF